MEPIAREESTGYFFAIEFSIASLMVLIGVVSKNNESLRVGLHVTIRARGAKGTYVAEFHDRGHRRVSLRTTNKKVAIQKAVEIDQKLSDGSYGINGPEREPKKSLKTISQARDDFKAFLETEGRRRKTIVKYVGILAKFIEFAAMQRVKLVAHVDMTLIDRYRASRKASLAPKSMHHEGALLKLFLAWCEERKMIAENPLGKRRFSPPEPKARHAPSVKQVNAILSAASELRRLQLSFLAFCGARSGEARNLLIEDVDFAGNWIHIRSRPGAETKSGQDRKVPIHERLRPILEEMNRAGEGWFFTALPSTRYPEGGHRMNPKRLNEDLGRLLKRLLLPSGRDDGFTVHSLRRFFRTVAVNCNVPERVVDIWLGHCDKKSMGTIYYDLRDEDSQRFMRQVRFPKED